MFALGLILILVAVVVVLYVLFATSGLAPMEIDWFIFSAEISPLGLFLLGALTVLVLSIGSVLLSIGLKRSGAKRAEVKQLRKEVKSGETKDRDGDRRDRDKDHDKDRDISADTRRESPQATSAPPSEETPTRVVPTKAPVRETPPRYTRGAGGGPADPPPPTSSRD